MLDDGEAKTRAPGFAATGCVHAIEAFGHPRQMLPRNAGPAVAYADGHPAAVANRFDGDGGVSRVAAVSKSIAQQIVEDLDQLRSVSAQARKSGRNIDCELAPSSAARSACIGNGGFDDFRDRNRL